MARVYVSSTIADLEAERQAVIDWLVAAQHQVVHSYRPSSDTVRDGCLADVDTCDVYVLVLGHRYGFQPPWWWRGGARRVLTRFHCFPEPLAQRSRSVRTLRNLSILVPKRARGRPRTSDQPSDLRRDGWI